jgi:MFS family permease
VAIFFAFFVLLQPVGAALGRRFGMARYVPACMAIWGLCTALHVWVRSRWQLITLRVVIGMLEGKGPVPFVELQVFTRK